MIKYVVMFIKRTTSKKFSDLLIPPHVKFCQPHAHAAAPPSLTSYHVGTPPIPLWTSFVIASNPSGQVSFMAQWKKPVHFTRFGGVMYVVPQRCPIGIVGG